MRFISISSVLVLAVAASQRHRGYTPVTQNNPELTGHDDVELEYITPVVETEPVPNDTTLQVPTETRLEMVSRCCGDIMGGAVAVALFPVACPMLAVCRMINYVRPPQEKY